MILKGPLLNAMLEGKRTNSYDEYEILVISPLLYDTHESKEGLLFKITVYIERVLCKRWWSKQPWSIIFTLKEIVYYKTVSIFTSLL